MKSLPAVFCDLQVAATFCLMVIGVTMVKRVPSESMMAICFRYFRVVPCQVVDVGNGRNLDCWCFLASLLDECS